MNKDIQSEFKLLEEWARSVARSLGPGFDILGKTEHILENAILCVTFKVSTELPARKVTKVVHETGKQYYRGRRYFFLFDRQKQFLFLLFYPFYIVCNEPEVFQKAD